MNIEGRVQAFAGDTFLGRMTLEQDQGQFAEQVKVLRPVAGLDAAPVFPERHIQLPVQIVLDPPVMPQRLSIRSRAGFLATDKITRLLALVVGDPPRAVAAADGSQTRPGGGVANTGRVVEHRVTAVFLPTVAALASLIRVVL